MVLAVAHPRASTSSYLSLQSLANSRSDLPCRLAPRAQGRLAKISRPRRATARAPRLGEITDTPGPSRRRPNLTRNNPFKQPNLT